MRNHESTNPDHPRANVKLTLPIPTVCSKGSEEGPQTGPQLIGATRGGALGAPEWWWWWGGGGGGGGATAKGVVGSSGV